MFDHNVYSDEENYSAAQSTSIPSPGLGCGMWDSDFGEAKGEKRVFQHVWWS